MNFFLVLLGYLGVCASEFVLVRNAILRGSGSVKFMLKQRAYWIALLIILAPLGGIVSAVMLLQSNGSLYPIAWTSPAQAEVVKSVLYGAAFTALLSGVKFNEVKKMEINDLQGKERRTSVKDVLRWYFSR